MIINVHRIKTQVSTKKSSLAKNLTEWLRKIFVFETYRKTAFKRKVRTAMIMY